MINKLEGLIWSAFGVAALILLIGFAKDVAPIMYRQIQQEVRR